MIMEKETNKYEEWLTTISNTRFIYNKMEELENMLENHSIHNNTIKRSFSTQQKMRAAFRDLFVEVWNMTDSMLNLETVLTQYKKAWDFFRANLARRSNPEDVALEMLKYCCEPYIKDGVSNKRAEIYDMIMENNVSVVFLVLMLLKVIPGYDSKDGDVTDMPDKYEKVIGVMEKFVEEYSIFNYLPALTKMREEENKTRIMLVFHVYDIINTYESYVDASNMYMAASYLKENAIDIDIEGYWNECGGTLDRTDFWLIEKAVNDGYYFITKWHKDANMKLTGIRYTMFLYSMDDKIIAYIIHPELIKHKMKNQRISDKDNVWYITEFPDSDCPDALPLARLMTSASWPLSINLTRVKEKSVVAHYDKWFETCEVTKEFDNLEYELYISLYAVTIDNLYVKIDDEGNYYKIPRDAHEGFDQIKLDDTVGIMYMNGKTYLVFDELMLYIETTPKELKKYGIEIVSQPFE